MYRPDRANTAAIRAVLYLHVAVLSVLLAACQGSLGRGLRAFDESRYPDAARELRVVEPSQLSTQDAVRWALYSGLTELSLGNQQRAVRHLQQARCLLQRDPHSLSVEERGRLESAWRSLGKMPGEPLLSSRCT